MTKLETDQQRIGFLSGVFRNSNLAQMDDETRLGFHGEVFQGNLELAEALGNLSEEDTQEGGDTQNG